VTPETRRQARAISAQQKSLTTGIADETTACPKSETLPALRSPYAGAQQAIRKENPPKRVSLG